MKLILSVLFVACALFATAQNYEVKYKKELRSKKNPHISIDLPAQYMLGVLNYSDGESNYSESEFGTSDVNAQTMQPTKSSVVYAGGGLIYKNIVHSEILKNKDILGKKFIVTYKTPKWKFTNEQQKIGGYICRSAEVTENGIYKKVWYTPEIPIADGPGTNAGLPGLILKVETKNVTIIVLEIKRSKQKIKIKKLSNEKAITVSQAKEITKKRAEEFARSMGGKVIMGGNLKQ